MKPREMMSGPETIVPVSFSIAKITITMPSCASLLLVSQDHVFDIPDAFAVDKILPDVTLPLRAYALV